MTTRQATEQIILMGGACSGQVYEVYPDTQAVTAHDGDGVPHVYVRTEATSDGDGDRPYRVFRRRD